MCLYKWRFSFYILPIKLCFILYIFCVSLNFTGAHLSLSGPTKIYELLVVFQKVKKFVCGSTFVVQQKLELLCSPRVLLNLRARTILFHLLPCINLFFNLNIFFLSRKGFFRRISFLVRFHLWLYWLSSNTHWYS